MTSFVADIIGRSLVPPAPIPHREWMVENFYLQTGQSFDETRVPWVTAPQGPCWAFDNPRWNEIWLQWAARMSKSNFAMSTLMHRAHLDPCEMMFATPDETNCKTVYKRWWRMLEMCPQLRHECPPENRQNKLEIDLLRSTIYGAWPRGKSRLADKSIPAGVGNEIDKWEQQSTSTEGDPLPRFLKRGAEYPDRKFVLESTPGTKGKSRIEAGRLQSSNHHYYVPCPHCAKFQEIRFGDGQTPGGIFWDKKPDGTNDKRLAEQTAHYVCEHCEGRIDDIHRSDMMNLGVWVPEGCEVDHDRAIMARDLPPDEMSWLIGEPLNWGNRYGSQISVFYALFHGWGRIVVDFLTKKGNPQNLRQWTNEDKAETWSAVRREHHWEDVAKRMRGTCPKGECPDDCGLITVGVDVQDAHFVYVVAAYAPGDREYVIDYGTCLTWEELFAGVLCRRYQSPGLPELPIAMGGCDSGHRTDEVYRFCQEVGDLFRPTKGVDSLLKPVLPTDLSGSSDKKRKAKARRNQMHLWKFSKEYWQEELQNRIDNGVVGEPGCLVFPRDVTDDQDFHEQILNNARQENENGRIIWAKIHEGQPDDYRDALVIARVAKQMWTNGSESRVQLAYDVRKQGGPTRQTSGSAEKRDRFVRGSTIKKQGGGFVRKK